jgi:hypothetical protein
LVWATDGKLMSRRLSRDGLGEETEPHDFNEMMFEPIPAPY